MEHDALCGQVGILSCSFNWGQPDSTLDLGDPFSRCTNNNNLTMWLEKSELLRSCYGHNNEPHGPKMQMSLSISTSFSYSHSHVNAEGGWQCTLNTANMLHSSINQDIVVSDRGNNTDRGNGDKSWEVKEQKFIGRVALTVKTLRGSLASCQK